MTKKTNPQPASKTTPNQPTYLAYHVRDFADKEGGTGSSWTRVGVAFPHKDGKGFNLKLDLLPLNGAELVIREPQADEASPVSDAA